jgi:hypothetical protein
MARPAMAQHDAVQFGANIHISKESPAKDVVCFFCSVQAEGEINGDVVVFFGNIHLNAEAHHDVVNFFGNTTLADNVGVHGDLVNFFGSVHLGENSRLGQDLVVIFGNLHAPESATVAKDHVIFPFWLALLPFAVILLVVWVIVSAVRSYQFRRSVAGYPLPPMQ